MEAYDIRYADLHFLNEFCDPKPTEMGDIKGDRRVLGQNVTVPRDGGILGTGEATQESLLHLMGNTVSSTNSTLHNHRQQAWEGSSLG